jgi:inositol polyphosphate 5-phosphatase INPP5B/F
VQSIRECLDTGTEFGHVSVHSMAETLSSFLTSLPSPVIPDKLLPTMELDAQNLRPWTRRFLEQLPPLNYNVFVYLVSFFREVLKHHEHNRLNTDKLAGICCNVLLPIEERGGASEEGSKEDQRRQSMQFIFSHFLTTPVI